MKKIDIIAKVLAICALVLNASVASSQNYPNKPVRIVAGAAGGGSDFTARQLAQGISGPLGQPVIVDNRGAVVLAAEIASKAQPDGYTLMVSGASLWIGSLLRATPYDVIRDFSPITLTDRTVLIVAVHPSVAAKSLKELIDLAKAKPGSLNSSSGNLGGAPHLATELFKSMAGVNIVNVPYKGNAPAVTALLGGEVQLTLADAGLLIPHMKSGKVRALAVTSAGPSVLAPGLPTVATSGVPGYESIGVTGIWASGKTPAAIINRLSQEIVRFLNQPETKEKFLTVGAEVVASSPAQFAAFIKTDMANMSKVIKDAGIKVD